MGGKELAITPMGHTIVSQTAGEAVSSSVISSLSLPVDAGQFHTGGLEPLRHCLACSELSGRLRTTGCLALTG